MKLLSCSGTQVSGPRATSPRAAPWGCTPSWTSPRPRPRGHQGAPSWGCPPGSRRGRPGPPSMRTRSEQREHKMFTQLSVRMGFVDKSIVVSECLSSEQWPRCCQSPTLNELLSVFTVSTRQCEHCLDTGLCYCLSHIFQVVHITRIIPANTAQHIADDHETWQSGESEMHSLVNKPSINFNGFSSHMHTGTDQHNNCMRFQALILEICAMIIKFSHEGVKLDIYCL